MVRRYLLLLFVMLLAVAGGYSGPANGESASSFGRSVGEKSRDKCVAAGNAFKRFGLKVGNGSKKLYKKQGKFWKKVGNSFSGLVK